MSLTANNGAVSEQNDTVLEEPVEQFGVYPLEPNELIQAPAPFSIPSNSLYLHPWTNRVTFVARLEGLHHPNNRIVFYAQGIAGVFNTRALFVAQRKGSGKYHIFNVYNDNSIRLKRFEKNDWRYVGEISKRVHWSHVACTLVLGKAGQKRQVSTTIFDKSSLRYPVVDGSQDRIVYSVVGATDRNAGFGEENNGCCWGGQGSLRKAVQCHLFDIHEVEQCYRNLKVFQSKRRFTTKCGRNVHDAPQEFVQRFGRRARRSSKKNLQLMDINTGQVILQMGRWNHREFTLDFLPPYTAFDAFGLALAQLQV